MASNQPFGFDPEDFDRVVRGAGEQLRGALGQFGGLLGDVGRRPSPKPEPATTGETGDGVWVIYTVDGVGGASIEQVYSSELDALRANKHNTESTRKVRFLPYGIPVSVLDGSDDS